jgi:DNA polymerase-3 subunit gamma/tau
MERSDMERSDPYIALARKYRPQTFQEVVGQEHITITLLNSIKKDRVSHAYLFSGPRGIGKTTTARLLAKSINCPNQKKGEACDKCSVCKDITEGSYLDVLEIDGASNRGIDEIRDLKENVKFAPAQGKYKIYIIDEVHMLTTEAFNALLKTLEEPPTHIKFIFATTALHKVPATISSRCQCFNFQPLSLSQLKTHIQKIARAEKTDIDEEALHAIARHAEGSLRDALSILDQLISFTEKNLTADNVYGLLGIESADTAAILVENIINHDTLSSLSIIDKVVNSGKDLNFFTFQIISWLRNIMILKSGNKGDILDISPQEMKLAEKQIKHIEIDNLFNMINVFSQTYENMRRGSSGKILLEVTAIRLIKKNTPSSAPSQPSNTISKEKDKDLPHNKKNDPDKSAKEDSLEKISQAETPEPINTITIEEVEKKWPQVIKKLQTKKRMAAAFLIEASPVETNEKTITIGFPKEYNFHKESVEKKDIKNLIESLLKEVFNRELKLHCRIDKNAKKNQKEIPEITEDEKDVPLNGDPVVDKIVKIFNGKIIK